MSKVSMFEYATRNKLRFQSTRGALSVEQLWDTPLRSKDGFDLNAIAKGLNAGLKAATEESFVDSSKNPEQTRLETEFELVKYVIQTKLDEEQVAKERANNRAEKARLMEILAKKQDDKLEGLSEKEIQRRIAALEA